ncbi:unnamed protein product [Darwinula stevensoni]|uniref:Exosome complex component 10 homolog n=1 Tax=Darwinula stevensoni TaxID=69355 RepID=A0A7R9AEZ5_9CRUS|nr:unnamed protein product [Darwinula stevensoni]CAG0902592.1 unnamed protein product [Darwinula stevensoni]
MDSEAGKSASDKPSEEKNDTDSFCKDAFLKLMTLTKDARGIPSPGQEWTYYSSFVGVRKVVASEKKRVLDLIMKLMEQQGTGKPNMWKKDIEEQFDIVVDGNDTSLERINNNLDEANGIRKAPDTVLLSLPVNTTDKTPSKAPWNQEKAGEGKSPSVFRLLAAKNIIRPQLSFKEKIDNSGRPFVPILKDKPNSLKPLALIPQIIDGEDVYDHPYEWELERFQPTPKQLESVTPQSPPDLEETPYELLDEASQLPQLIEELRKCTEIAVDVEHHSYRTFQGLTCLIQISTRTKDYLIDALALRYDLQCLNEVFTHPKIVKVFHGANQDIIWLQRDLGVYVVNMFDTFVAATILGLQQKSLAFLLNMYCKVDPNKHFQLADWRIRPLPDPMVKYAREDTHYLLNVYDQMKNELLQKGNAQKNLIHSVISQSRDVCLTVYRKPKFAETSYMELYKRSRKFFNARQLYALQELFRWRDKVAREEDESIGYVLPNHMLLGISETLPREMQGILACCNPIPPLVRSHLLTLHHIILKAREQSLVTVDKDEDLQVTESRPLLDMNNEMYCPHDLSKDPVDGPCLMEFSEGGTIFIKPVKVKPLTIKLKEPTIHFGSQIGPLRQKRSERRHYLTPYERYCHVLPLREVLEQAPQTTGEERVRQVSLAIYD